MPPRGEPPGRVPPGGVPPGSVPPGRVPPGNVPPGRVPPGRVPPGRVPPGRVPPGSVPPGRVPPRGVLSRSVSGFISSEAGGGILSGSGDELVPATVRLQGMKARRARPAQRTIERSERCDIATPILQLYGTSSTGHKGGVVVASDGHAPCRIQSIRCEGLSCLSCSLNEIDQTNQRDHRNSSRHAPRGLECPRFPSDEMAGKRRRTQA